MVAAVIAVAAFGLFYFVVPRAVDLESTLEKLRSGDVWWLIFACLLEAAAIFGQVVLLRGVFSTPARQISRRTSAEITLAGAAATKLVATAGAGGIAVTVWALRALGLSASEVGAGMFCYEILTYAVYMVSLVIGGLGLRTGLLAGPSPVGVTLIPALLAAAVIALVLSTLLVDEPAERWLLRRADHSSGRRARWWRRVAALPRSLHAGLLSALGMVKRRDASTLGAIAYWGFDIGVLWASFHAFGHSPPGAVLVVGYFVGTLGNALPLPGGVGGVEGGMIAAFLAFGVSDDLAVLAVLGYRTVSYWLPAIPGAIAYAGLRHDLPPDRRAAGSRKECDDRSPG